jgi:1-acyl-sn-glycerol-3-phosphate acyltransferase
VPVALRARLALARAITGVRYGGRVCIRAIQLVYLAVAWTIALLLVGPVVALLVLVLPAGKPVRIVSRIAARIALLVSGCRVAVDGRERVPRDGPVVFVTNHTSYADTPVLAAALPRDFKFVAMTEILSWPAIGAVARRGRHLMVDRWHRHQSVADAAAVEKDLRAGHAVLFFAEGGFSRARGLRPFRLGAFEAATATGASVVPVALRGSREVLPADTRLPHPGAIHLWIGEPIRPSGQGWQAIIDLRERTAEAIAAHCGEPRVAGVLRRL